MDSLSLAKTAAGILDAKKADQINVIRITNVSSLGDYFVIANGTSSTHVHALADELEVKLKEQGVAPARVEGYRSNSWIVLDYDDVVDDAFDRVKQTLIRMITENTADGEYALDLLMIAKYFERIGDHAVNIAEWVEFSVTGVHKGE